MRRDTWMNLNTGMLTELTNVDSYIMEVRTSAGFLKSGEEFRVGFEIGKFRVDSNTK